MGDTSKAAKTKRMDLAFASLLSKDDEEVLSALTRIGQEGDARAIRPLLTALASSSSTAVQQRITAMLFEVKAPQADVALFEALEEPTLKRVRPVVLSTFWNAGIDVKGRLETFVDIALEGDVSECFECLTVIENQEVWGADEIGTALQRLEGATGAEMDPHKATMLGDLQAILRQRLVV